MIKPMGYIKDTRPLSDMSRRELKIYYRILTGESEGNTNYKYAVEVGDIIIENDIAEVEKILGIGRK